VAGLFPGPTRVQLIVWCCWSGLTRPSAHSASAAGASACSAAILSCRSFISCTTAL